MILDGWKELPLEGAAKVIDCKHRTPIYVDKGIPLISPGTIKWGALDLNKPTKRVSFEEYTMLMDHCSVEIGDLVLGRNQSVGVAAFVNSKEPFVLGQDTVLIQSKEVDSKYLFYALQSSQVQRKVFKLAGGSTFSRINLGDIRKLKISYPPLPEQKKIAEILSAWDKAIETVEKLIENSQQKKKALMQQLLTGKKRFPGFEEEWLQYHFHGVFKRIKHKNTTGNKNVLTISGQKGLVNQREVFNKSVASSNLGGYTLLHKNDFAYNKSYSNGYPMGAIKPLERYESGVVSIDIRR